jgi:hypothetical protein
MEINEEVEDDIDLLLLAAAAWFHETESIPQHNSSHSGHLRYLEIMESNNTALFHDETRMDKSVFIKLLARLSSERGGLQLSRSISPGQKLMMFIMMLKATSMRDIANHWQHSTSTISICIHEVAASFMRLQSEFFIQPDQHTPPSAHIVNDPRFYPYFSNCIGALDGTHIPAFVNASEQAVSCHSRRCASIFHGL